MKSSDTRKSFTEEVRGTTSEIIRQVKKIIRKGNARRLMIQDKKGKILFQTQLTAGIAGTALLTAMAPIVSAISMFALFMNDVKVIVEKYPEEASEEDEYEVEADAEVIVEIEDEQEGEEQRLEKEEKSDKTVGKEKKNKGEEE